MNTFQFIKTLVFNKGLRESVWLNVDLCLHLTGVSYVLELFDDNFCNKYNL